MTLFGGLDAGLVAVKVAVVDHGGQLLFTRASRHFGRPGLVAAELLAKALEAWPQARFCAVGSAGRLLADRLGLPHCSEIAALAQTGRELLPGVTALAEMGGEDAKLLLLSPAGEVLDFTMSTVCAAGTGAFLDQQAQRMGLSVEEFSALAARAENPARIAGRCSVFAKSDMIHLQQIGAPRRAIAAGLCRAVASNFSGTVVKGRALPGVMAFLGGVAKSAGMVRAMGRTFDQVDIRVPDFAQHACALGAALVARRQGLGVALSPSDLDLLRQQGHSLGERREPLVTGLSDFGQRHARGGDSLPDPQGIPPGTPVHLGIDIGSISTNLALVDDDGRLLAKRYLRTASRPIEAVKQGLRELCAELSGRVEVRSCATTGSGRYMIADVFGADLVKNEITAQAHAAASMDPLVDTIFEIGGQDSKFISLKNGVIVDFEMNRACAAGTGSFLEEQADRLGVCVKSGFSPKALAASSPCRLGERCTVFMENALAEHISQGAGDGDLLAGLAYSVVENYLSRVVAGRPIGRRIFFQGGTAFNKAVVAAFERVIGRPVTVPAHHDVTGALGMALLARDHAREAGPGFQTAFKGFAGADLGYALSSSTCTSCENLCEIHQVKVEGAGRALVYGGRCEKWDLRKPQTDFENLFAWREQTLFAAHREYAEAFETAAKPAPRGRMGLPLVFFLHERLPYYATLLWELGFEPVPTPMTSREAREQGGRLVLAETCFPVKAAMGHAALLVKQGLPIFVPSVTSLGPEDDPAAEAPADSESPGQSCPLTQAFPYLARQALPGARILAPVVHFGHGPKARLAELFKSLKPFGVSAADIAEAHRKASRRQAIFERDLALKGREVLARPELSRAVAVIGRAYNAFDPGMNLNVGRKLASLGVTAIPADMLPEAGLSPGIRRDYPHMYWRSGRRMLGAARLAARDERLLPLVIGSFSCGPDAFIHKHLETELAGVPSLFLEIDEHSADAGAVTRLEAFLDSARARGPRTRPKELASQAASSSAGSPGRSGVRRRVYVPRMSDHAFGVAAAFRACGVDAAVMPETTTASLAAAKRLVSGKECFPCAVTTADLLSVVRSPDFDRGRSAFFMPGGQGPCRFGQYSVFHRELLAREGYPDVPVHAPMQDGALYRDLGLLGTGFEKKSWYAVVVFDLLIKCLHHARPREVESGAADLLYESWRNRLFTVFEQNGDIEAALLRMRREFEAMTDQRRRLPLVGVVGEIFVRLNRFSNEDLIRRIEELGGEAWLAPMDEWVLYVNHLAKGDLLRAGRGLSLCKMWLRDRVQRVIVHRMESFFAGYLPNLGDPPTGRILELASDVLPASLRGEAVLSVGKAADMLARGCRGIVNAMPFGCMPGAISQALLRPVCEKAGAPLVNLAFDGSPSAAGRLALEAFMERVRR